MKQPYNEREKFMPDLWHKCRSLVSPQANRRTLSLAAELRMRLHVCKRSEEGGTLVEMALSLPILMVVLTGIFSFGITLNNYLELTDAVGIGARYLALQAGQNLDPCAITVPVIEQAAPLLKPSTLTFTFVLKGTSYSGTSCNSSSFTTGAAGNLVPGQPAQVTVTYPCTLAVYGLNLAPSCTLSAQTTEIVQ